MEHDADDLLGIQHTCCVCGKEHDDYYLGHCEDCDEYTCHMPACAGLCFCDVDGTVEGILMASKYGYIESVGRSN